jgi:aldehyde:ferredoxin oxidoreductase
MDRHEARAEPIAPELLHRFIGGKGLAGHFLLENASSEWSSPEMPILLFAGPLVGTSSPTSGRMTIMSRSPLTGTVGDTSVGGGLGHQLKKAGWDGIIVTGHSSGWTGIEIEDDQVRFEDATGFVGCSLREIHDRLKSAGSVAAIGPAAENGVRFASIMVDRHYSAGRNGLGLTFAAKNLRYIRISGTGKVKVHDPAGLKSAREEVFRLVAASPILLGEQGLTHYGTPAIYDLMHARRMMPTDNFRSTHFDAAPSMNAHSYKKQFQSRKAGCKGCHILCKRHAADGRAMPEFETMSHFSALLKNEDMETVVEANRICNEMGMDTITAAVTLACHAEIRGKSLAPAEILSLLEDIGYGRGVGRELGEGSLRYATANAHPEMSITVKGMELPAYDPRGAYGMALAYATSTRGGCHLRAYPISHEILRKPVATDRFSFSGKARIIKIAEDLNAVVDSLTACKFVFFASSLEEYAKAYTAVTGEAMTAQDLLRIGERIYYQERIINYNNGFRADDDDLPARFFSERGSDGNGIDVPPLPREEFLNARSRYYHVRGLDETGRPLAAKAKELELAWNDS